MTSPQMRRQFRLAALIDVVLLNAAWFGLVSSAWAAFAIALWTIAAIVLMDWDAG